jgi:predicted nucleotidyltransferase
MLWRREALSPDRLPYPMILMDTEAGAADPLREPVVRGGDLSLRSRIGIETDRIAAFCRQNHIRHLALYGSVLREDFRAESDVDVLVEFSPGQRVGFFRMAALERELSQLIGRRVDLRTPREISRYFRDQVIHQAETQYAEG